MKPAKGLVVLPMMALVIIASGCIGGGGNSDSSLYGVTATRFSPTLSTLKSGEQGKIYLTIENTGDYMAKFRGGLIGIDTTAWNVQNTWTCTGELFAATEGAPGQSDDCVWSIQAPKATVSSLTYTPKARIYYSYRTMASKPIWFVSKSEVENSIRNGETLEAQPTVASRGPVEVQITTGEFVKTDRIGEEDPSFYVQIHIQNSGGGFLAGAESPVLIKIKQPEGSEIDSKTDCSLKGFDQGLEQLYSDIPEGATDVTTDLQGQDQWMYTNLWESSFKDITCRVRITNMPVVREARNFEVELAYVYYTDVPTSITVQR